MLVVTNVAVAFCLVVSGAVWGYIRYRLDSIPTQAAPHLTTTGGGKDSADGLPVENILLIGNQTRAGLTSPSQIQQFGSPQALSGSLSDVIMILHLDPLTRRVSILSIPRDLFVPMPPGSPVGPYQKIDAALNDGAAGPDNLIQAITDDFGIPINHYIELTFNGLEGVVNSIGGISLNFPEPLFDLESGLNIPTPGCVHLNGAEALALVRSRHLQYDPPGDTAPRQDWPFDPESDLSRIARDHTFLRVLASRGISEGLTNPVKANAFIGAIINDILIDPGLRGQLVSLAFHYRHVNPAAVPELTLPITTVNNYTYGGAYIGDVDFPVEPLDDQVIAKWEGTALAAPTPPSTVDVYSLTGYSGIAATTTAALRADGLNAVSVGVKPVPGAPTETLVYYPSSGLANAIDVMNHLSGAVMMQSDPALPAGTVEVDAGSLLAVTPPPAPPSSAPATSSSTLSAPASSPTTSTTVPTPLGELPSSAKDQIQPWDPTPCPAS